ncbi:LPS translocon maturation chaperone LptM [Vibrio proteolyticus]
MKKSIMALFLLSVMGLAGCGQTGPLYFPEDAQQNQPEQDQAQ